MNQIYSKLSVVQFLFWSSLWHISHSPHIYDKYSIISHSIGLRLGLDVPWFITFKTCVGREQDFLDFLAQNYLRFLGKCFTYSCSQQPSMCMTMATNMRRKLGPKITQ